MPFDHALLVPSREQTVFGVKWMASAIQILGYTATAFDWTPWNHRAIMLIHVVALGALLAGMSTT